ncbi:hypothetical protein ACFFMN_43170 [Planobispora siamensis]|uniref:Uncharacterized protein n=1 Tax=Planobispora siamensis TaxID=936338 RepID=A0A8J3WPU9_9ACTN|nr:hypothetical protein [Planobispora siamensis]GIH97653.1 hypothetical protein Psi01_82830 [Planobispora siamensis]
MNATTHRPARWKTWLLTVFGIYPVIIALAALTEPVLGHLPAPLRLAVVIPVAVAVMTWLVMPFLTRRCAAWLAR